jgi:Secretion system C-terminal sorting domain
MRTITTFLLLLFFTIHLSAQGFGPLGTTWTYTEYKNTVYPYRYAPFYLHAEEEVMYSGLLCRKITASGQCNLPEPCYIYDQNDTVYFYSHITQQFEFLYDFKAEAGDIWQIKGLPGSVNNGVIYNCNVLIDSVSTRMINGTPLKVWHFTIDPGLYDWGNEIIEGFGSTCFLMPSFWYYEQQICGGRCIESPGIFHQLVDYDCDEIVIISDTNEADGTDGPPEIYPVPATSRLTISWKTMAEERQCDIYDMTGRLMEHRELHGVSACEVDISRYLPGVYTVITGGRAAKFVVQ